MKKISFAFLVLLHGFMVICPWQTKLSAQDGTVRVTAARANIRSEPHEKAPVLLQVTAKTILTLRAVEGDWYRIQVPPDPKLGPIRIEAYISSKVATILTPIGPAERKPTTAPSPAPAPPSLPEPAGTRDGMSVAVVRGNTMTFLDSDEARLRITAARSDSFRTLAATLPKEDAPPTAKDATPVTYAWTVDGATSATVFAEKRPSLVVIYKDARDLAPADLTPVLVKLTPTISAVRVVGFIRGRADQASRTAADWDVIKDLKQDVVRATVALPEPGAAQVTPLSDLEPGEYAVVLRPNGKKKLSGASVLAVGPDSRLFTAAWTFSIK
jgi:Bacterial SH3 domain